MVITQLLPLRVVQQNLGVSRWTLYAWIRDGKLHAVRVGAQYRITLEEFQRLQDKVVYSGEEPQN